MRRANLRYGDGSQDCHVTLVYLLAGHVSNNSHIWGAVTCNLSLLNQFRQRGSLERVIKTFEHDYTSLYVYLLIIDTPLLEAIDIGKSLHNNLFDVDCKDMPIPPKECIQWDLRFF